MYVPYHTLPDNARVWIYQSSRAFTEKELTVIEDKTIDFIEQWTRHGEKVRGSFTVVYGQFLIVAVDQDFVEVSGCSIDASVKLVQQFQVEFNIDMLNKLAIAYKVNETVQVSTVAEFSQLAKNKQVTPNTIVFNNMIDNKKGVETLWEIAAKESWQSRFFN